jgi:MFS family permease
MNNLSFIDDSYPNPIEYSRQSSPPPLSNPTAIKQKSKYLASKLSLDSFRIKNANIALAILCTCAFWQNMLVGGANNAILTTIERAFYMKSIESALFLSCYDIGNILTSPFISYLGDRIHKPKLIGLSMIGLSIGSFIMTVPEFVNFDISTNVNNEYSNKSNSDSLICSTSTTTASNLSSLGSNTSLKPFQSSSMNDMKYVFYIANTINGISSVALYTIVISYIENIFEKDKVHMRQGIYYAIGAIGVGMGM